MKEIMAIIRADKVNKTKEALGNAGFPAFCCRPCLGRGKKSLDATVLNYIMETGELPVSKVGEAFTETARLIPKRILTLVIEDEQVDLAIKTIFKVNQTGSPGDGKIFVLPIEGTYKVRTGETIL